MSVAFDDASANVRDFFLANGGEWPVITTDTGSIAVDYGVTAVPESYLVARVAWSPPSSWRDHQG